MSVFRSGVVEHQTDYGRISRANRSRYWIVDDKEVEPQEYGAPDEPVPADELDEYDQAVELANNLGGRNEKVGHLWAVLVERFGKYGKETIEYDTELRDAGVTEIDEFTSSVPIVVARENSPAIAAYLAVHGLSFNRIARLLDLSESTIEQYVSDVRRGER